MSHKPRAEMIEETRTKLIRAARQQFGEAGYAATVMDDLTAQAGLTRGALYHHFGDKKGLFLAVLQDLDRELDARLDTAEKEEADEWSAFKFRCQGYLAMSLEPEVQRIMFRDAASVLDYSQVPRTGLCAGDHPASDTPDGNRTDKTGGTGCAGTVY